MNFSFTAEANPISKISKTFYNYIRAPEQEKVSKMGNTGVR